MKIGEKAPDFLGYNEKGEEILLSHYKGHKLILYFYPKDNTPGCTAEACSLRDHYESLRQKGYKIVGVSMDTSASHQKFIAKHQLPFPLIADTERKLVEAFGVWGEKKMCGRTYMGLLRTTFLLNEDGIVEKIIGPKKIQTKEHGAQLLEM